MEQQIEERASKCYEEKYYGGNSTNLQCAYIQGATDQRKIDIEKACNYLCVTCRELGKRINSICIEKEKTCYKIKDFRKAMEEISYD